MNEETKSLMIKAVVGIASPIAGTGVSVLSVFEAWLRVGSLVVGIAVGIASFIAILRTIKKNKKEP